MKFKLIKTTEDYNQAINILEELGDSEDFQENEASMEAFELLSTLIELYEKEHFPVKAGHPIEIIKLRMEYLGLTRKDLTPLIGSSGVVSEVMNKKRGLSKKMIRNFSELLGIDQSLLNPIYGLDESAGVQPAKERKIRPNIFSFISKAEKNIKRFSEQTRDSGMLFNLNVA